MIIRQDYGRYGYQRKLYEGFEEFRETAVFENTSIHSIDLQTDGRTLDLLIEDRHAETTFVLFHAALGGNPEVDTFPVFTGQNFTSDVNANLIYISDPSLVDDTWLAWFGGSRGVPLQWLLPEILTVCIAKLTHSKYLAFFGPSGGGFAALYYSTLFPGSLAIPVNPQTDLSHFNTDAVARYLNRSWGVDRLTEAQGLNSNLCALYSDRQSNYVMYLQNVGDVEHVEHHFIPWLCYLHPEYSSHVGLVLRRWGVGHVAAPSTLLKTLFDEVSKAHGNWRAVFETVSAGVAPRPIDMRMSLKNWLLDVS